MLLSPPVTVIDANNPAELLNSFGVCSNNILCIASVPGASPSDYYETVAKIECTNGISVTKETVKSDTTEKVKETEQQVNGEKKEEKVEDGEVKKEGEGKENGVTEPVSGPPVVNKQSVRNQEEQEEAAVVRMKIVLFIKFEIKNTSMD